MRRVAQQSEQSDMQCKAGQRARGKGSAGKLWCPADVGAQTAVSVGRPLPVLLLVTPYSRAAHPHAEHIHEQGVLLLLQVRLAMALVKPRCLMPSR